jgi:hypothetical protein
MVALAPAYGAQGAAVALLAGAGLRLVLLWLVSSCTCGSPIPRLWPSFEDVRAIRASFPVLRPRAPVFQETPIRVTRPIRPSGQVAPMWLPAPGVTGGERRFQIGSTSLSHRIRQRPWDCAEGAKT